MSDMKYELGFLPVGRKTEFSGLALGSAHFVRDLVGSCGTKTIYYSNSEGYSTKTVEEIFAFLTGCNARISYEENRRSHKLYVLTWKDKDSDAISGYLDFYVTETPDDENKYFDIQLLTRDQKLFDSVKEYFKDLKVVNTDNRGFVFSIVRNQEGHLQFTRLGVAGVPLEKKNYTEKVISDYEFIVQDLKSKTPSGRVSILEGIPGSGKTFIVRGLLMDVEQAMFVIIPASTVPSLAGPELLPMLLKHKESYGDNGPIILILEDADQCLVPRQSDNISSISSLLNLGDGILGSLLDIRIIATTNAKQEKMDQAILRPGRLSKRIEVNALPFDQANSIFQRLVEKDIQLPSKEKTIGFRTLGGNSTYTLAEIYGFARENGWKPPVSEIKEKAVKQSRAFPWDDD